MRAMRTVLTTLTVLAVLPLGGARADQRAEEPGGVVGLVAKAASGRQANDLRVRLKVKGKRKDLMRVKVRVRNRGTDYGGPATVSLVTDEGETLWSTSLALQPGESHKSNLEIARPATATQLTCRAEYEGVVVDDRPEDNESHLGIGAPPTRSPAAAGAAIWLPKCSGCHGTDGRGGRVDENVSRESWREILEAVQEGEDGMPRFRTLGKGAAKQIAAYLADPDAATPDPGPIGGAPTYRSGIRAILNARCVSCHGPALVSGGVRLNGYKKVRASAQAALNAIANGSMPPSGNVPAAERQALADWISNGRPR